MNRKIIIEQQEQDRIRGLYNINKSKGFVFDFVLTENEKYVILMDQVFVAGGNGKSIGSIWENTFIFNELIKESIDKIGVLNEEIKTNVNNILDKIEWKKDLISEWVIGDKTLSEGLWDSITSVSSDLLKTIGSGSVELVKGIFNKGVLPLLRWVRRGLYTGVGIVIDVIVSILAVKTNFVVWVVVASLDIYEIATGDFDPQDPNRMQMPFFFLIADLLGCVFSGFAANAMRKSAITISKEGLKSATPATVKLLKSLSEKIPSLKGTLKNITELLGKKLGPTSNGVISTILKSIDGILSKVLGFINKLFTKKGLQAASTGGIVVGAGKVIEKGMGKFDKNNVVGKSIASFDKNIKDRTGYGSLTVSKSEEDLILSMINKN